MPPSHMPVPAQFSPASLSICLPADAAQALGSCHPCDDQDGAPGLGLHLAVRTIWGMNEPVGRRLSFFLFHINERFF